MNARKVVRIRTDSVCVCVCRRTFLNTSLNRGGRFFFFFLTPQLFTPSHPLSEVPAFKGQRRTAAVCFQRFLILQSASKLSYYDRQPSGKACGSLSSGAGCREEAQQRRGPEGFLGERAGRPASDRGALSRVAPRPRSWSTRGGGMSRVRDSCGVCFGGSWRREPNFMVAAPCGEILETLTKQILKLFFFPVFAFITINQGSRRAW